MTNEPTQRPRRTPTDDEIPSLLESLKASGGNIAAFAREHGLATWKLYEAQRLAAGGVPRRLLRRRREDDPEFVPVHVVEEPVVRTERLELVLGSGHHVLIPSGFDGATLRRLMGVLASC